MVSYVVRPGGPIVFTADIEGFGPVTITSLKPRIFNGRVTDRTVLRAALTAVEAFVDQHEAELAPHYAAIGAEPNAA